MPIVVCGYIVVLCFCLVMVVHMSNLVSVEHSAVVEVLIVILVVVVVVISG